MVWRDRSSAAETGEEASWKARIFVAAANTNNVYAVAVSDNGDLRLTETINVAMTPHASAGHDAQRAGAQPG